MLTQYPFAGNPTVASSVFLGEWMLLAPLLRQLTVGMKSLDSLEPSVDLTLRARVKPDLRFLEETEVVPFAVRRVDADHPPCLFVNDDLALERVPFLLA